MLPRPSPSRLKLADHRAFSALPFAFSKLEMSYTDAFFESMSGITTTGATVIIGLDNAPPGILLWRSILQWLGGIGIIVFALAFLPVLRVGGMQLFRTEAFETPEKVLPRAAQLAAGIGGVYIGLTVLTAVVLWAAQMAPFDAVNHAMTSIATGGFSTRDASIGAYPPLIQWICRGDDHRRPPFVLLYVDRRVRGHASPACGKTASSRVFLAFSGRRHRVWGSHAWRGRYRNATRTRWTRRSPRRRSNWTSVNDRRLFHRSFDKWGPFPFAMFFLLMFVAAAPAPRLRVKTSGFRSPMRRPGPGIAPHAAARRVHPLLQPSADHR